MIPLIGIRVFISGSRESEKELRAFKSAFERFNLGAFARQQRFRFEASYWLDDVVPARPISGNDPQSVVDHQLGQAAEYDIVLGVLKSKLGDGTRAELDSSLAAARKSGLNPLVLIYDAGTKSERSEQLEQYFSDLSITKGYLKQSAVDVENTEFCRQQVEVLCQLEEFSHLLSGRSTSPRGILVSKMKEFWPATNVEWAIDLQVCLRQRTAQSEYVCNGENFIASVTENQRMLITGAAAAGKTHLLRQIMHKLLDASAWKSKNYVPVYLLAASWVNPERKHNTFDDWVRHELRFTYKLSRKTIDEIVRGGIYMLFVDGLDSLLEADPSGYDSFMQNVANESTQPMFLACRSDLDTHDKLRQFERVKVLPLDVNSVLSANPELENLIEKFPGLRSRLDNPLIVSLLRHSLVNGGKSHLNLEADDIIGQVIESVYSRPFDELDAPIGPQLRRRFLKLVANIMGKQGRFLLDRLQPEAVPQRAFRAVAATALFLMIFLIVFLPGVSALALEQGFSPIFEVDRVYCLRTASLAALVGATLVSSGFYFSRRWFMFAVMTALGFGCARGILVGASLTDDMVAVRGFWDGFNVAISTSLIFLPVIVYFFSRVSGDNPLQLPRLSTGFSPMEIRPLEVNVESLGKRLRNGLIGIPLGALVGVLLGVMWGWNRGLGFGIAVALLTSAWAIFSSTPPPRIVRPNQAIEMSFRTSTLAAVLSLLILPVVFGLSYSLCIRPCHHSCELLYCAP